MVVALVGQLIFQQPGKGFAGVTMGFACLLFCFVIVMHATHYSSPSAKKQYVFPKYGLTLETTYLAMPKDHAHGFEHTTFATVSFLAERKAIYLTLLLNVYEAAGLAIFFLLLCDYIERSPEERGRRSDKMWANEIWL